MSIYPEDISTREFVVVPEGFDRDEVKAYLEVLAREQRSLRDEIAELRRASAGDGASVGEEVADVLTMAKVAAEEAVRLATKEADELRGRAQDDTDRLRKATGEASEKVRTEADEYAAEVRAQADADARRRLEETNERIERLLAGAASVRDRLVGLDEILTGARAEIAAAAGALEGASAEPVDAASSDGKVVDLREVQLS